MEIITKNAKETSDLGSKIILDLISKKKNSAVIIALNGNLGSGKTTFVQGIGRALGIKRVVSPTFMITKMYRISTDRYKRLIHTDAYRLQSENNDPTLVELKEYMTDPKNIIVIEWAEKVAKSIPSDCLWISFEDIDDETRKIKIN